MLAGLTGVHLLLIVGAVVLLFGASKLPLLAKNLGQSVKVLKSELAPEPQRVPVPAETAVPTTVG